MSAEEAMAEAFWVLFRRLSKSERRVVVRRLLRDKALREDLLDTAIIEQRRREPSRPLDAYPAKRARKAGA
jgi:hypothetical protein